MVYYLKQGANYGPCSILCDLRSKYQCTLLKKLFEVKRTQRLHAEILHECETSKIFTIWLFPEQFVDSCLKTRISKIECICHKKE